MNNKEENKIIQSNASAQISFKFKKSFFDNRSQSYVPFSIKAKRFQTQKDEGKSPPIGHYEIRSCFDKKPFPVQGKLSQIIMDTRKKKMQDHRMKSSTSRFHQHIQDGPGPASYNLLKNQFASNKRKFRIILKQQKLNSKSCPSIPNKKNRYGYTIQNGKIETIEKNLQQIQRQKEARKIYTSTLDGQRQALNLSSNFEKNSNTESKTNRKKLYKQTLNIIKKKESLVYKSQNIRQFITIKPKYEHLYHSKGVLPDDSFQRLGPGQYDVQIRKHILKPKKQKFQFFGSTEVRFRLKQNTDKQSKKGYSLIQMIKENIKNQNKIRKQPIKRINYKTPQLSGQKQPLPGPGQYDPQMMTSKNSKRSTFFPYEQRFKQSIRQQFENLKQNPSINANFTQIPIQQKNISRQCSHNASQSLSRISHNKQNFYNSNSKTQGSKFYKKKSSKENSSNNPIDGNLLAIDGRCNS